MNGISKDILRERRQSAISEVIRSRWFKDGVDAASFAIAISRRR